MISATTSRKRARLKSNDEEPQQPPQHDPENDEICSFCRKIPAAVSVQVPVRHRKKRAATLFCLSCYYTTSVVRQDPEKYVSVFNQTQLDEQLPQAQALFSEVFVELRKELEEEAERAFQTQKSDPLAMLHQAPKRRPKALLPPGQKKKEGKKTDGGFLRDVPIPDRLRKTQEDQLQLQRAQMDRMKRAAKQTESSNLYQRRKPSKASIWNLAMAPPKKGAEQQEGIKSFLKDHINVTCSCGSSDVRIFGNVTSRNQDMSKGETWGMKDRGNEVVTKYQCNNCGKTWQEEE